ncbi:MAG: PilZ domain-containing protein [Candidatus Acidiferrales bacterium]
MANTLSPTLCADSACGHAGSVALAGRDLCRGHFIAACYQRLEECSKFLDSNDHWKATSGEPFIESLVEIVDQTAALGLTAKDLDRLEQAQLLDILFTAGNLLKNLRRSVRKFVSMPLKLCYQVTGHNWSENTITQELSMHGASMECRIPIGRGELMTVERTDIHRKTQAKVRWQKRRADGSQLIGIELLDSADFWRFNEG